VPLRRSFTYAVPEALPVPEPGSRVRVPFGERVLTGVVVPEAGEPGAVPGAVREILEVLDAEPVCPPELLTTAARVAERFFAATGEVLKSVLPARLPASGAVRYRVTEKGALAGSAASPAQRAILERLAGGESLRVRELPGEGSERRAILRRLEEMGWIRAAGANLRVPRTELAYDLGPLRAEEAERALGRSRRGREVVAWLGALGRPAAGAEIRAAVGAGAAVLRSLVGRGVLRSFEQERRASVPAADPERSRFVPTDAQAAAIAAIRDAIQGRRYFPALLEGVTGSGKTEVYLQAIRATLATGRGAIWLVPEIALTPVFARELGRQFPADAAVLHSALSERERADAWDRVREGAARAVIGPRSAAFAPVADPGLFVVDEEHDASYKQRESPRYDAREAVALRASQAGAALVFGSATPSMEAWNAARRGKIAHLRLPERIAARPLPEVAVVDLRRETARPDEKGVPLFSAALVERMREVFSRREQVILLQPRRGFAPFLLCRDCGHDFRCRQCSVARTVHDRGRTLLCHYCGERIPRPARCPECGGGVLEAIGAGTERVAERFAELFPGVSHAILDRDTSRRPGGAAAVVEAMRRGQLSCLIGTQMVAKGHDFAGVTAVGVLSADTLLHFPDFRSAEKTFQLLAQVAGRAGRGDVPGTVHVQTFHPSHPAIRRAAAHDVAGFAEHELEFRRSFFYPPFSELASLLVSAPDRGRAERTAADLGAALAASGGTRLSGPAPAPLERLQGRWRFQILLRAADRRAVLAALEAAVPDRAPAGVQVAVDVDPQDLL